LGSRRQKPRWFNKVARRQPAGDCRSIKYQISDITNSFASHIRKSETNPSRRPNVWFCRARRDQRRQTLRLRRGNPAIEVSYRTHWVSPELSEKKRERLAEKASHALEMVVVQSLNAELICHRCGGAGDLLMIEAPGPACLRCVGLDDLAYLPTGDAPHAARESKSTRYAVVVRFSRTRRRYERQGLLVGPQALPDAR
jgi:hypothetical protein